MKKDTAIKISLTLLAFLTGATYAKFKHENVTIKSEKDEISYEARNVEIQEQGIFYISELEEENKTSEVELNVTEELEREEDVKEYPTPISPSEELEREEDVKEYPTPINPSEELEKEKDEKEYPVPVKPESKSEKSATISKINLINYKDYSLINIEFDKEVNILTSPKVYVTNKVIEAYNISSKNSDSKKFVYRFSLNSLDVFDSGKVYITITDGRIVNSDDKKVEADYIKKDYAIGILNSYSIIETYEEVINNHLGDMDLDGMVDATDASTILRIYTKLSTGEELTKEEKEQMSRGDVDQDGKVTQIDAQLVLSYYVGNSTGTTLDMRRQIINCDLNNDRRVTVEDYDLLKKSIGNKYNAKYDINLDGKVDEKDLESFKTILKKYGQR